MALCEIGARARGLVRRSMSEDAVDRVLPRSRRRKSPRLRQRARRGFCFPDVHRSTTRRDARVVGTRLPYSVRVLRLVVRTSLSTLNHLLNQLVWRVWAIAARLRDS